MATKAQEFLFKTKDQNYTDEEKGIIESNKHLLDLYPTFLDDGVIPGTGYYGSTKTYAGEWTEDDVVLYRYYRQQEDVYKNYKPVKEYKNFLHFILDFNYSDDIESYTRLQTSLWTNWGVWWDNNHYTRKKMDAEIYYPQYIKWFKV